jgi:hypothetical protein
MEQQNLSDPAAKEIESKIEDIEEEEKEMNVSASEIGNDIGNCFKSRKSVSTVIDNVSIV